VNSADSIPRAVSSYDLDCDVQIANTADIEIWEIQITFRRPKALQIAFQLPCRVAIKGWLPWNKSPLQCIPDEMMRAPNISSAFLLKKALSQGVINTLPDVRP
jgi:hypothetical protein